MGLSGFCWVVYYILYRHFDGIGKELNEYFSLILCKIMQKC